MDRSPSSLLLSWLLAPVAFVLVQSALSLPRQPYTGLLLQGDRVMGVEAGSPGERAGFAPGDRIALVPSRPGREPLAFIEPGRPVSLERVRGERRVRAWLVPDPLPDGERRMLAGLLAVSSVFVLLGGTVWGERRDALARVFFLVCLSFAYLLAPLRRWTSLGPWVADQAVIAAIQVLLPALMVHFFALFPEGRARGSRSRWIRAAYAVAAVLLVPSLAVVLLPALGIHVPEQAGGLALLAGGLWFAIGLLAGLSLFAASYRRAPPGDARRRLRVALYGTLLGAGPLAAIIAVRSVLPGLAVPGERWAAPLTLLVPASFAWATVVHRIFDFRVALRVVVMILLVAAAGALCYAAGEAVAAWWWPDLGARFAGGTLACVALAASLAGPAAPWLRSLGARMMPEGGEISLSEWMAFDPAGSRPRLALAGAGASRGAEDELLGACEILRRVLRLDSCAAVACDGDGVGAAVGSGLDGRPRLGAAVHAELAARLAPGVTAVEEAPVGDEERDALERAGVRWLVGVDDPPRAVLLLGGRLAGAWLGRREVLDLERFAQHLAMRLENLELRREASTRGALEAELREAGAIQAHLLPRQAPVYPTLDCAAATLSSESVGGDYYDFVEGPGRDLTLAVGDAAGKGVPAALVLAQVQARFRSQAQRGLSPGQILGALNQELTTLDQPERFVGLLCARVEVRAARVWFANAGLTPPLIRRAGGEFVEVLSGGVLLGVSGVASYPDSAVDLDAGDLVVVYTDGLTEARRGEELFGTDRLRAVLDAHHARRAADILEGLLQAVRGFADRPLDDLTVLVFKQLAAPALPAARPALRFELKDARRSADAMR